MVGADRGATMGTVTGLETIMQPMTKLNAISDKAIVGVSGPVGLGQLYVDRVEKSCTDALICDTSDICRRLRDEFIQDAQISLQMSALASQVIGPVARGSSIATVLIAIATREGPTLIEFDSMCNPEIKTSDLPFVSIGSGQVTADPFLAFIKKILWQERSPTISDGCFAILWTLRHTIETTPGGIGFPVDLAVLTVKESRTDARFLPEAELREHEQNVTELEEYISRFTQEQRPTEQEPEPPSPPVH